MFSAFSQVVECIRGSTGWEIVAVLPKEYLLIAFCILLVMYMPPFLSLLAFDNIVNSYIFTKILNIQKNVHRDNYSYYIMYNKTYIDLRNYSVKIYRQFDYVIKNSLHWKYNILSSTTIFLTFIQFSVLLPLRIFFINIITINIIFYISWLACNL